MHKIFGKKQSAIYLERRGAYIIPIKGEEVGVVETPKGLFLLGGGIDNGIKYCVRNLIADFVRMSFSHGL